MSKNLRDVVLCRAISRVLPKILLVASSIALAVLPASAGTLLISNGSPVQILVPADDSLGNTWQAPAFDASTWTAGISGVGYQSGAGGYEARVVADSVSEWSAAGRQGENYWFYGYYDLSGDADATYDPNTDFNFTDPNWNFVSSAWRLGTSGNPDANPPWDTIGQTEIHPNGINNGGEHWAVRRWISTYSGEVTIQFHLRKSASAGTGVTGKIFQNGTPIFSQAIAGSDTGGFSVLVNTTLNVGDKLDFVQTPIGPAGETDDDSDGSQMTVRIIEGVLVTPVATTDTTDAWGNGSQGQNGWYYGYYEKTADANGVYEPATDFFTAANDSRWQLSGSWEIIPGDPPWTSIGQVNWHPAGPTPTHWAIKRWVSTLAGDINIRVQFGKQNTGCGNGTTLRVLHNGTEVFAYTVAYNDGTGIDTYVILPGVNVGDFIEFALDPFGTDGTYADGCDGSRLRATVYPGAVPFRPGITGDIGTNLESAMKDVSSSVFLRFPFDVANPADIGTLRLELKYNDGYVAYLNGVEIDKRNAPTVIVGVTNADSIADWSTTGTQGENGWYYGYYNKTADLDATYAAGDFTLFPPEFWDGGAFNFTPGDPPWTFLAQEDSHPNGANNGEEHWVMRRWVSDVAGDLKVRFRFRKSNTGCGDGVIGAIFHNGAPLYSQLIEGTDGTGRDDIVEVPGVQVGDTLDIAIQPNVGQDWCDGTFFSAVVFSGVQSVPWNAAASGTRTVEQTIMPQLLDLTGSLSLLVPGPNVLAIQGINAAASDDTFLIAPALVANQLPIGGADTVEATQPLAADYPLASLLANDVDPDGDMILVVQVSATSAQGGSVTQLGDTLRYTPPLDFVGSDSFTYTIADGSGTPVPVTVEVTVLPDTTPPSVVSISANASLNQIVIQYSEPMDDFTAADWFNYRLPDPFSSQSAVFNADKTAIILTLDAGQLLPIGEKFCVELTGIYDRANNPLPDSTECFTNHLSPNYALEELWFNIGSGNAVADLTSLPAYPNSPSAVRYRPLLETVTGQADAYGTRISGWLKPPETGNYNFAMASDDNGEFWLSTDVNPANKVLIASEPVWCSERDWLGTARRNADAPENRSTTLFPDGIPLVAGEFYYFEALMKEGGGGDNLGVTWQLPSEPALTAGNLPISGKYIYTLDRDLGAAITITQQPQDATFSVSCGSGGGTVLNVLDADFNADNGGFAVVNTGTVAGPWVYNAGAGTWSANGSEGVVNSRLSTPTLTLSKGGTVSVTFHHRYNFEGDASIRWDSGAIWCSVNGGDPVYVPATDITGENYKTDLAIGGNCPPNNGKFAFNGKSPDFEAGTFVETTATLGLFNSGDTIAVHFMGAWDEGYVEVPAPNWEVDRVQVQVQTTGSGDPVEFAVAAEGSFTADVSAPMVYQWQRSDNGTDWVDIPGATATTYRLLPNFPDDGAMFRAVVALPTLQVLSDAATLTVIGVNAAPLFTAGPDQTVPQNAGAVSVPAWATDISPGCPEEAGQNVDFIVSNDNGALFAVQPAISPDGTLTYTADPARCGVASVTAWLHDDGGTANNGNDTSEPATFTITVTPVNECPVAENQTVVVVAGSSMPITLSAIDADLGEIGCGEPQTLRFWVIPPSHGFLRGAGANLTYTPAPGYCGADSFPFLVDDGVCFSRGLVSIEILGGNHCPVANPQTVATCQDTPVAITLTGSDLDDGGGCGPGLQGFAVVQSPACGTLSGTPPSLTYTPAPGYAGTDSFTFTATDGECTSAEATVAITVRPGTGSPVCQIVVGPLLNLTADQAEHVVLACDNLAADVVLDGSLSSDPGGQPLTFMWLVDDMPAGTDPILTQTLEAGTHTVTLVVDSGSAGGTECGGANSSTCTTVLTVADGSEAVDGILQMVEQSHIGRSLKRTLARHLNEAARCFANGDCHEGVSQLQAFIDKIEHYVQYYAAGKKPSQKYLIDPATAARLVGAAQALIDAYGNCDCMN
ncbi:MAG: tandem-95 repeat protein [Verrucomicrobia bacterium]|nr:tandem-95 repeat protein [Verrucomicrobiota bacterium]